MKKIIVLGAGMVGRAMAIDLCREYEVTSADYSDESLTSLSKDYPISTLNLDFRDKSAISKAVADFDLVVGAAPGFLGFETVKTVIEAGKNIVDISFFPENLFLLDELAKSKGVTAIVDCGVAPGLGNIILGFRNARMTIENYNCYVGGLPVEREFPFEYKAPFSPIDVIEEYTRPARYVENGFEVIKPALSDSENLFFLGVGTLEAFNTDGLRSLIKTMKIPNMKEKTLRYPNHINYIKALKESGFFGNQKIQIGNTEISPIDFTTKLLFSKWKLGEGDKEFTVMRILIDGSEDGRQLKYMYNLQDRYDEKTKTSSMARTTGYTCTAAVRLVTEGKYSRKGIIPPEYLG
ncbi:MAG: hypothetical protein QG635_162, partial [Bacteroidota bacterium]|nr:hypothetical protein [Bacteroidota bacterium]